VSPARPHSIRNRLTSWFAAQAFFCLSVACLAVYLVTAWSFGEKQDAELDHKAQLVQHLLEEGEKDGDLSFLRHKLEDFFSLQDDVRLSIARQSDGSVFFRSEPPAGGRWLQRDFVHTWGGQAGGGTPLSIRIGIDVAPDVVLLRRLAWTLLAAAVLGTLLVRWLLDRTRLLGWTPLARLVGPPQARAERRAAGSPRPVDGDPGDVDGTL
jgi:two-component system heavy metal sensor histidine kinase CusS